MRGLFGRYTVPSEVGDDGIMDEMVTLPRSVLRALLDEYRNDVRSEWSSEVSRTHDPEYFAVVDAMETSPSTEPPPA